MSEAPSPVAVTRMQCFARDTLPLGFSEIGFKSFSVLEWLFSHRANYVRAA